MVRRDPFEWKVHDHAPAVWLFTFAISIVSFVVTFIHLAQITTMNKRMDELEVLVIELRARKT